MGVGERWRAPPPPLTLYVVSLKCHFFSYNIVCANYPHHSLGFRAGSTL